MKSALKITVLFIILILVISGLSVYWTFYRVVPSLDDSARLPDLKAEVIIEWDDYQIPHITASHETDLLMTMGYLHARDRLWQMTLQQYKLEGLHSREIDGGLIDIDRFYLTLSFGDIARKAFEQLPPANRQLLEAYARGVNYYVSQNKPHLPVEFSLSDARPVHWEPWHSIGVQLLWAWQHQQAFWTKPAYAPLHFLQDGAVTRALTGMEAAHQVMFGPDQPVLDAVSYDLLLDDFLSFTAPVKPMNTGSPGVGMALSRHSPEPLSMVYISRESVLELPDQGYEMVVTSDRGKSAGMTIPGFPAMIYGQNETLTWALQPMIHDDGDFFTGRLFSDPMTEPVEWESDPEVYSRLQDEITLDRHILSLKNGGEVQVVTKKANGRPVVAISENTNRYLAFGWTGLSHSADITAYMEMSYANSPGRLRSAISSITSPAVQVLYATSDGQAGRFTGGHVLTDPHPLRIRDTHTESGISPANEHFAELMHSDGQPVFFMGQIASARARVGNRCMFSPPWNRSARLLELLGQTPHDRIQAEITTRWHRDTESQFAARLTPQIIAHLEHYLDDPFIGLALPYLRNWNYEFGRNETAATLFQLFLNYAARNLYLAYLGERELSMIFMSRQIPYSAVSTLLSEPARWPESHSYTHREWIFTSMSETVRYLSDRYGNEPHDWQWNHVVDGSFQDLLFNKTQENSRSARLAERNLFNPGKAVISGSPHTLQAIHLNYNHAIGVAGATTSKRIMMLQPENKFFSVMSTGQSGHVFSDHYGDQFQLWNDGALRPPTQLFAPPTYNFKNIQHFRP